MQDPPVDDSTLLQQAQAGSPDAFGALYERHALAVFRYLAAHLTSSLDAEDLTGDVFLRAWQAIPKYRERGVPFLAFLLRIARNALIDHYRRSARPGQQALSDAEIELPDVGPGPAELTAARHEQRQLASMLAGLPGDYRTVLVLRFINELSPDETAVVMRRSPGAVRVLQHRALAALRKQMQ